MDRLTANNGIALFYLVQEAEKHRSRVEAPIVAEAVLIEVGLQVAPAD